MSLAGRPSERARSSRACAVALSGGRTGRNGFTLIELLLVIAIIAVLIGILLPSLGGARRSARAVACLSNIRQLAIAHTLYMDNHRERFIDAGLGHGGLSSAESAWPVALQPYYGGAKPVLRSPVDRSVWWPVSEGGQSQDPSLQQVINMLAAGQNPGTRIARWTSYGLNNFLTRFAQPSVTGPNGGPFLGPWDRLSRIPRPHLTVHFLMMTTQGRSATDPGYAVSDHVHAEDWGMLGPAASPALAASQMEIAAHGGAPRSSGARSNYGFLDGHAATLTFGEVYRGPFENRFFPDFVR